jgi:hypothetical protein
MDRDRIRTTGADLNPALFYSGFQDDKKYFCLLHLLTVGKEHTTSKITSNLEFIIL